ncbi:hypothetical protein [Nitrosophilus labii]|uniref:hypothetical protein n=1 Tax=Nitrosophilus labii TaxID=2706014 RepID=UPI00165765B6|nr:hypothetical protein [Nitrosophilus labii]
MKVPLIISYKSFEPVNLYNVESFTRKNSTIIFHFSKRSVEWIFQNEEEAQIIYEIILKSYVRYLDKE